MNKLRCIVVLTLAMASFVSHNALSADPHFRGFISQGIIYSGDNPFFDDETGTNFNYRELGLNVSWSATDKLRFAGQALSRKAGLLEDGDPRVDFLLMDYNFYVSENFSAGIRLGRVKNHYGLYNTSRDVPHGRPGVFVPQSVYFEAMRTALLSSDGGNLYLSHSSDFADISLDIYGGKAHFDTEAIEYALFQIDMPGKFDDVDGTGVKLSLEPRAIPGLTAAYTRLEFDTDYQDPPVFSTPLEMFSAAVTLAADQSRYAEFFTKLSVDAVMTMYSLQYAHNDWVLTSEYMTIDLKFNDVELINTPYDLPRQQIDVVGYYLQAEWLPLASLSVYGRYEELFYDKNDKDGSKYAEITPGGNPITQYNKTYTLGARWYFNPDFSVTAEYSINEGTAFLNGQTDVDYSTLEKDWDLLIIQFSYHF